MLDLHSDCEERLGLGLAPVDLVLDPAEVRLIDLNAPPSAARGQGRPSPPGGGATSPGGLIGPQPERPLPPDAQAPCFLRGQLPGRL
jgi:hypothetical protein